MTRSIALNKEDVANIVTHSLGLLFFLIATPFLIYRFAMTATPLQVFGISLFCASLILVYLSSTIYHTVTTPRKRQIFKIIDHICIYFLIAGTHTPLVFIYLNHFYGWMYVSFLWTFVLVGIFYKIFLIGRYEKFSLFLYLLMGWSAVVTVPFMWPYIPTTAITLLIGGGISYSLGTIFFVWEKLPFHHAIWHLFVIGGSVMHFLAFFYCL